MPDARQTLYPNLRKGSGTPKDAPRTPAKNRSPKGRFLKGNVANPNGRPLGSHNHATLDVRALSRTLVEDPIGLAKLREQYREGQLPPPVLCMLWHYAYGKPKERIEVQGQVEVLRFVVSNSSDPALDVDVVPQLPAPDDDEGGR